MKMRLNDESRAAQPHHAAFTLIEMIGVLAVIAILAALLIPKVFSAINDARINGVCISTDTIKAAAADHYGKYGKFEALWGTNLVSFNNGIATNYDVNVLMVEGLTDKPFNAKVAGGDPSTNATIQLLNVAVAGAGGPPGSGGQGYKLDGNNPATTGSSYVLQAVLYGVNKSDAKDLNDRIDGAQLGAANGVADYIGRVEYDAPPTGEVTTDVYIYLTHR
jgi:prepilin-type N-terminal cleavage/methylation domain-containing protein